MMSAIPNNPSRRTVKRVSRRLNRGKWLHLLEMVRRYAQEKDLHLQTLAPDAVLLATPSHRTRRDALVATGYQPRSGLQARMWKCALKDAHETHSKGWAALAVSLRKRVAGRTAWSNAQRHYANWLLKTRSRTLELVAARAPVANHITLSTAEQQQTRTYLRRVIRRTRGQRPRVKRARSLLLDADMYTLFEHRGQQYLAVMSLLPRQRVVIPLRGKTVITGDIRLVLDPENQRVFVHVPFPVRPKGQKNGNVCGLDAGMTEVFTDEQGNRYGTAFGSVLKRQSDGICDKGRRRGKLRATLKRAQEQHQRKKASRIRRFNLGTKKQTRTRTRMQTEIARQVNTAINQVLRTRQPAMLVTEKLDMRGKTKSKRLSRLVSQWARGTLNERIDFKASAGGSRRKQVNPAYTSQTCPTCGYVHRDNRNGDKFQCRHCGHRDNADRVAAHNLGERLTDHEITVWTPHRQVFTLLQARFIAGWKHTV